jgi:hypothetical protein
MSLITRQFGPNPKNAKLSIEEMDNNLLYLQQLAGGALPVLTEYPETTPELAGTRFWYKGNEWHYMTQDEIDSTGWTGLAGVGFPAPVSKGDNYFIRFDCDVFLYGNNMISPGGNLKFDALGYGQPTKIRAFRVSGFQIPLVITDFKNVNFFTSLEDYGTGPCIELLSCGLTDVIIDDFFTQLPPTTKTATIDVRFNPGSATCDPTIATAKGYTVIVNPNI